MLIKKLVKAVYVSFLGGITFALVLWPEGSLRAYAGKCTSGPNKAPCKAAYVGTGRWNTAGSWFFAPCTGSGKEMPSSQLLADTCTYSFGYTTTTTNASGSHKHFYGPLNGGFVSNLPFCLTCDDSNPGS
jgi:hypothetical protein